MKILTSTNPSKGYEKIGEVEVSTPEEIVAKVAVAHMAKEGWRALGV